MAATTITGTGNISLGEGATGYVVYQDGSRTAVFHHRHGTVPGR